MPTVARTASQGLPRVSLSMASTHNAMSGTSVVRDCTIPAPFAPAPCTRIIARLRNSNPSPEDIPDAALVVVVIEAAAAV